MFRKGQTAWNKGKKASEKTRGKMSTAAKARNGGGMSGKNHSKGARKRMSLAHKGKKASKETKKKMSNSARRGKDSPFWKGGITTYKRKLFLNARRRARLLGAEGSHTQGEWELLKRQYGYTCPACGKTEPKIKLTEDHIIPLVKGGSDWIENIQPLCKSCNSRKYTKSTNFKTTRAELLGLLGKDKAKEVN